MNNKAGSALLIVIFILSALLMSISAVWQSTSYMLDLSLQRVIYEQRLRSTEGLLLLVIGLARENYDQCIKLQKPIVQSIGEWACGADAHKKHEGYYSIQSEGDGLLLKAELMVQKKVICSLQCQLEYKEINNRMQFVISSWKINEAA